MFGSYFPMQNMYGLLGQYGQPQYGGLLGGMNTQQLMQNYLQNIHMRRYQPPPIYGADNQVRWNYGPGGRTYQAPTPANKPLPSAQSNPLGFLSQPDSSGLQNWLQQQYAYAMSGGGGG